MARKHKPEEIIGKPREAEIGVKTLYITPGSPWENGYCESFNGTLRDELLNGENFYTLAEAQILIEAWRRHYNTVRPHSSLGYRPPAPEAATTPWLPSGSATLHLPPAMRPRQFYTNKQRAPLGGGRSLRGMQLKACNFFYVLYQQSA